VPIILSEIEKKHLIQILKMPCNQKLCKRNSNITSSGNCSVCQNAIDEALKQLEASRKKGNFKKVDIDFKLMLDTHKKLENGIRVDPMTLNVLVLGGVVNILCQSEALEQMEDKMKTLEQENITNKIKMENLENWIVKQHDLIEELNQKISRMDENGVIIKESRETENLQAKVLGIEIDVTNLKKRKIKENPKPINSKVHVKKCTECETTFLKNSDLEKHVINIHGRAKAFKCESCDKAFVLEWRLRKHLEMHERKLSICKYFAKGQYCPYEEIGCKFSHEPSDHGNLNEDDSNDDGDLDLSCEIVENQCHLCKLQMLNRDDLFNHVEHEHVDYHQEMLEIIASRRITNEV